MTVETSGVDPVDAVPAPEGEGNAPEPAPAPEPAAPNPDPLGDRLAELGGEDEDTSPATPPAQDLNTLDVEALGDEFITAQVSLLKSYLPDIDLNKALGQALEFGDKGMINAFYINEIAGDNAPAVIKHLESLYDNAESRTEELGREIMQLAGGEERWKSAVASFNAKASKGVQRIVRELLSSYNQKDYIEAAQVVLNYADGEGAVNQPANLLTPQAPANSGGPAPLTRGEYTKAIAEAQSIKDRRERQRVETELATRRAASRRAGIN